MVLEIETVLSGCVNATVTGGFRSVTHEIDEVMVGLHHLDVLITQELIDAINEFLLEPILIPLLGKSNI